MFKRCELPYFISGRYILEVTLGIYLAILIQDEYQFIVEEIIKLLFQCYIRLFDLEEYVSVLRSGETLHRFVE